MTTSAYFLLVALGLLLYVCQSSFDNQHTRDPDTTAGQNLILCGSELADYYQKVCRREIDDAGKKRGQASPLRKQWGFLSMPKARAKRNEAFLLQRNSQGIVSKCCENSCTHEEFIKYCPVQG
uniref:Venom gland insulin La2 n=1 Tax=Conus laterculatus TaxID=552401 RepID=A0A8T9IQU5_9COND|nr:venom gland insulin precursor La2 [Conus laterculatus]